MDVRVTIYRKAGDLTPIVVYAEAINDADRLAELLARGGMLAVVEVGHMEWSK